MKTIEQRVYTFEELSQEARESVIQRNIDSGFYEYFNEILSDAFVPEDFPHSEGIMWESDFSHSQGSGFNFCGEICLEDLLRQVNPAPMNAINRLPYPQENATVLVPPNSMHYTYCRWDLQACRDLVAEAFEDCGLDSNESQLLAAQCCEAMTDLCARYYELGILTMEQFYDPSLYEGELYFENGTYYGFERTAYYA